MELDILNVQVKSGLGVPYCNLVRQALYKSKSAWKIVAIRVGDGINIGECYHDIKDDIPTLYMNTLNTSVSLTDVSRHDELKDSIFAFTITKTGDLNRSDFNNDLFTFGNGKYDEVLVRPTNPTEPYRVTIFLLYGSGYLKGQDIKFYIEDRREVNHYVISDGRAVEEPFDISISVSINCDGEEISIPYLNSIMPFNTHFSDIEGVKASVDTTSSVDYDTVSMTLSTTYKGDGEQYKDRDERYIKEVKDSVIDQLQVMIDSLK